LRRSDIEIVNPYKFPRAVEKPLEGAAVDERGH
jgi:hypothetical protein